MAHSLVSPKTIENKTYTFRVNIEGIHLRLQSGETSQKSCELMNVDIFILSVDRVEAGIRLMDKALGTNKTHSRFSE